jgi:hypothetical protein
VSDTLTYVYALAREVDPASVGDLPGVAGGPVRVLSADGVAAIVSDVDRAEFEERALEERLEDLEWLAATARAHHHVVDTLGRDHLVAPLALATVYFDDDRVRTVLAEGREAFGTVLDQLAGRAEWGLKVYARGGRETTVRRRVPAGAAQGPAGERDLPRRRAGGRGRGRRRGDGARRRDARPPAAGRPAVGAHRPHGAQPGLPAPG